MAFAPESVSFDRGDKSILGGFREKDHGHWFEYSRNDDMLDLGVEFQAEEYPHKVWVTTPSKMDSGFRYAVVKKTVAYIVTDEDDSGNPVVERWDIKQHREYTAA
jgi:hypothetical protein